MATRNVPGTYSSIQAGINAASSGDTVLVAAGTYNERITINKNVTVKTTADAKIRGSGTIVTITGSGATLDGFRIERPSWESGRNDLVTIKASGVTVKNCTIYISNVTSASAAFSAFKKEKASGIVVQAHNATIENCEVWGACFGVAFSDNQGRHSVVRNCNLHHTIQSTLRINLCPNLAPNGRGLLVEGCNLNYSYTEDGIQWLDYDKQIRNIGTMVRNCMLIGNAENALDFKGCTKVVVEGCIMTRTEGNNDGMQDGRPCGSYFTIGLGSDTDQENCIIRNCVVYNSAQGLSLNGSTTKCYNNVAVYGNYSHKGSQQPACGKTTGVGERTGYSNMGLRNNIIGGFTDSYVTAHMASGYDIDYNCYFDGGSGSATRWKEGRKSSTYYSTFSAWKNRLAAKGVSGQDAHSMELGSLAAVKFTNCSSIPTGMPGAYDFSVQASSPAYQAGGPLTYCASSGTSNRVPVRDSKWFCDGHGSPYYTGDTITVGSTSARITSISGNTLTLNKTVTFNSGTAVYWGATNQPHIGILDLANLPPVDPDPDPVGDITANFSVNKARVEVGTTVNFTDTSTSTNTITAWSWKEDGTQFSTSQNPSRTYNTAGTYDISLTVTSVDGSDTLSRSDYITVTEPATDDYITANFTASATSVVAPATVTFTDTSESSAIITAWVWKIDGRTFSTSQNPTYEFTRPGSYQIALEVTSAAGSDALAVFDYITVVNPPAPPTGGELLENSGFGEGATGWEFHTSGSATFAVTDGVAVISVQSTGGNTQIFQSGIQFVAGAEYTFSLTARCASGTVPVTMRAMLHDKPYTSLIRETKTVTTTNQTFTETATATQTISNGRVTILIEAPGTLFIDAISFSTAGDTPPTPTPTASDVVEVATVACNTSTGNQTITLTGGLTPTAAMFIVTPAYSGGNPADGDALSIGFADSSGNEYAAGYSSSDNAGTTYTVRRTRNDACCSLPTFNASTTDQCRFSIVSMGLNQIVINVDIAPANAVQIEVHAFEATEAALGTVAPSTTDEGTATAESGMAGTPDLLLTWTTAYNTNTFPSGTRNDAEMCFGVSDGTNSYAIRRRLRDNQAAGSVSSLTLPNYVFMADASNAAAAEFDSTGWVMRTKETAGSWNGTTAFMALRFASNTAKVYGDSIPTTSQTKSHTIGQISGYVGALATTHDSYSTTSTKGAWSLGGWDGSNEISVGVSTENAADPTQTTSRYNTAALIDLPDNDGTDSKEASVIGNSSTNLNVAYTNTETTTTPNIVFWSISGTGGGGSGDDEDYIETGLATGLRKGFY